MRKLKIKNYIFGSGKYCIMINVDLFINNGIYFLTDDGRNEFKKFYLDWRIMIYSSEKGNMFFLKHLKEKDFFKR